MQVGLRSDKCQVDMGLHPKKFLTVMQLFEAPARKVNVMSQA